MRRIILSTESVADLPKDLIEKSQMLELQTFGIFDGARDETRTHTGFTPLAPETSASTISPPAHSSLGTANIENVVRLLCCYFNFIPDVALDQF